MSVKVGVRVRPFNKRQIQLGCRTCVQMQQKTTRLVDNQGNRKNFVFDYSFWSHDKFMVDPDGIYIPVDEKYADQQRVYQEIGSDILVNSWQGYNCCLFAYGQTGSGKSYSMIGYGANRGIIPIVCDQIFKKIAANNDKSKTFQVMVSMMQIYNESVRDLLQKGKKKQLKICESKKLGVYVQGLYKHGVNSYQQIAKKIQQGSNNRSIAATLMNQSSSRSHTIVSISFIQRIQLSPSQTSIKYSNINLVDLAGSECVAKTGVDSKDRLRQTAKINQSLSTLGRVIQILADNSSKVDKTFVPYRDSKLTFILRNALGGNSRTAMICAISPADDNFEETLSTLRYANRAKNIQNKAIVNQSDVDKLIRMLRQQNEMLKKMLQQAKFTKTVINQQVISNYNRMSQNMVQLGIMSNQENLLDAMNIQLSQKSFQNSEYTQQQSICQSPFINDIEHLSHPYITNISQDQLLSFRVKYSCQNLMIGNKLGVPKPDVVLAALGILPNHARIWVEDHQGIRVWLEVIAEEAEDYTYLNGNGVIAKQKRELYDNDRLIFGTGCIFLVVISGGKQRNQLNPLRIQDIDYQFAIKEMQNINLDRSRVQSNQNQQQLRKKIVSQIQKQYQSIKLMNQQSLKQQITLQQKQYLQKLSQIQSQKNQQTHRLHQQLQRKNLQSRQLQQQKLHVQQQIQKYRLMQKQMQIKMIQEMEKSKVKQVEDDQIIKEEERIRRETETQDLEKTNTILMQKLEHISLLEQQIGQINKQNLQKELQIKLQIQKQEALVQRQLQVKTIMCQNQNIITQYRLQLIKRTKNAKQLRQLLVKKQKAFLQKQLIQLVPMIQKFNLMGKQMSRRIQAGLSIQYKFISQSEIIQALKNNTYKSKLKILIHILNKQQGRGYYWSIQVFRNRFQHAIDAFQAFVGKDNGVKQNIVRDKNKDPYWEPEAMELFGISILSLQSLLYQFQYSGMLAIVNQGKKLGEMEASLFPLVNQAGNLVRVDNATEDIKISNPRDLIERSLSFQIQLKNIKIQTSLHIQKIRVQYEILESNYKIRKYQSQQISFNGLQNFIYRRIHTINQISQNTILHYTDRPISFSISAVIKLSQQDQLTNRQSFLSNKISSFVLNQTSKSFTSTSQSNQKNIFSHVQNINLTHFTQVQQPIKSQHHKNQSNQQKMIKPKTSGAIVDNVEIMSKIQNQYQAEKKRKENQQDKRRRDTNQEQDKKKKKKDENCITF